ncbi:hypothetical protein BgiBS90_007437 [Biomphalaria glabrata]|nr:hypothetical protein BgiBS90_007437 [Biomphalaria glabrata]
MNQEDSSSLPTSAAFKQEPGLIESSSQEMEDKSSQSVCAADRTVEESNFVKSPEDLSYPSGPSLAKKARVAKEAARLIAASEGSSGEKNNSTSPGPAVSPPNFLTVPAVAATSPAASASGHVHTVIKSEPRDDIKILSSRSLLLLNCQSQDCCQLKLSFSRLLPTQIVILKTIANSYLLDDEPKRHVSLINMCGTTKPIH